MTAFSEFRASNRINECPIWVYSMEWPKKKYPQRADESNKLFTNSFKHWKFSRICTSLTAQNLKINSRRVNHLSFKLLPQLQLSAIRLETQKLGSVMKNFWSQLSDWCIIKCLMYPKTKYRSQAVGSVNVFLYFHITLNLMRTSSPCSNHYFILLWKSNAHYGWNLLCAVVYISSGTYFLLSSFYFNRPSFIFQSLFFHELLIPM